MPRRPRPPALVGGPYHAPPCEPGSSLVCRIRGRRTVVGLSDSPIQWPYWVKGQRVPIVCGDLVRAIHAESVQAICHYWGVGRRVVSEWRRAMGVGRMTPGTRARWEELAPRKFTREARSAGGKAAGALRRGGS